MIRIAITKHDNVYTNRNSSANIDDGNSNLSSPQNKGTVVKLFVFFFSQYISRVRGTQCTYNFPKPYNNPNHPGYQPWLTPPNLEIIKTLPLITSSNPLKPYAFGNSRGVGY